MTFKLYVLLIAFILSMSKSLSGQPQYDVIYPLNGEAIKCQLTESDGAQVKYKPVENLGGPVYAKLKQDILMVLRQDGQALLPKESATDWIKVNAPQNHKVFTVDAIYPAKYVEISGDDVNIVDPKTEKTAFLPKSDVILIVYKDGGHELLGDATKAYHLLSEKKDQLDQYATSRPSATPEIDVNRDLDEKQMSFFKDKALQKSVYLGKYLTMISDKDEKDDDRLLAKDQALKLFAYDTAWVEVSSVNHDEKMRYPIGDYLDRIYMLPYDRVELLWINADFIGSFRKGEDGRYYGIVTAQQLFRGFSEGKIVYQDVTEKNIEVVLDRFDVLDEGQKKIKWDVFLSDISVQQTREK